MVAYRSHTHMPTVVAQQEVVVGQTFVLRLVKGGIGRESSYGLAFLAVDFSARTPSLHERQRLIQKYAFG